ncbi:MAG: hypothetical protein SFY68_12265 [Candidatus Sumerlaeia bacterium]|nr:hypothetical protein [Candidatus Sumerlaeia bacterium]
MNAETEATAMVGEKTLQRWRAEEAFLWMARIVIIGSIGWAGFYAIWGLQLTADELQELAETTDHDSYMFGATILLGLELTYYLYVSSAFRQCREWGMFLWALGIVVVILNLRFNV